MIFYKLSYLRDALRDLVTLVQFQKTLETPMEECYF